MTRKRVVHLFELGNRIRMNSAPSSRARSPRRRRFERDSLSSSPSSTQLTHLLAHPPSCRVCHVSTVCSTPDDDLKLASLDGNLSECLCLPSPVRVSPCAMHDEVQIPCTAHLGRHFFPHNPSFVVPPHFLFHSYDQAPRIAQRV
jgi:hypothetical protein